MDTKTWADFKLKSTFCTGTNRLRIKLFNRLYYGHIIAIDEAGLVVEDLQDPAGGYPINTSVTETTNFLYIGSLVAPVLGRIEKGKIGL
jgi:hypothetical protein